MPQKDWSDKRERQYEHIKDSYQDRGVRDDEAEERAARTVNKELGVARRDEGAAGQEAVVTAIGGALAGGHGTKTARSHLRAGRPPFVCSARELSDAPPRGQARRPTDQPWSACCGSRAPRLVGLALTSSVESAQDPRSAASRRRHPRRRQRRAADLRG